MSEKSNMVGVVVAGIVVSITCLIALKIMTRRARVALDATRFVPFKLTEKIQVSQDTYIFRFTLHSPDQTLGLPIGQHIALRALCDVRKEVEGSIVTKQEMIQHSYTPISSDDEKGYVDFLVKVYFANVHPKFPFGGRLSQHLCNMQIGQTLEMMGPKGRFEYLGSGKYTLAGKPAQTGAFAMVAGGTGITPMLQVMRAIRKHPEDRTQVFLVYGNQTESDILLRKEIDAVVAERPGQFHAWYTIDREPSPTWKYDVGFVTEDMLREHLPTPKEGNKVAQVDVGVGSHGVLALMCGPPPMLQFAIKPNLEKMGYTADMMVSF